MGEFEHIAEESLEAFMKNRSLDDYKGDKVTSKNKTQSDEDE